MANVRKKKGYKGWIHEKPKGYKSTHALKLDRARKAKHRPAKTFKRGLGGEGDWSAKKTKHKFHQNKVQLNQPVKTLKEAKSQRSYAYRHKSKSKWKNLSIVRRSGKYVLVGVKK